MHVCIASIILIICAIYLLIRSFKDSGIIMTILLFLFGPFVAWFFIIFQYKESIVKKVILFLIYYVSIIIVLIAQVQMILTSSPAVQSSYPIESPQEYSQNVPETESEEATESSQNDRPPEYIDTDDNNYSQDEGL